MNRELMPPMTEVSTKMRTLLSLADWKFFSMSSEAKSVDHVYYTQQNRPIDQQSKQQAIIQCAKGQQSQLIDGPQGRKGEDSNEAVPE